MPHDTTRDPRILVARLACGHLKSCVKQKPRTQIRIARDKLIELASNCESAVMTLTYLYLEPASLAGAEPMKSLLATMKVLEDAYGPVLSSREDPFLLRARIRWCLRTLKSLPDRLRNPGKTMASGADLVAVQVRSVLKEGGFFRTRVTDGAEDYAVITNLTDVEANATLAAAFLPPREIGGFVSEAMFLGSRRLSHHAGTILTEEQVDAREAAGILFDELSNVR